MFVPNVNIEYDIFMEATRFLIRYMLSFSVFLFKNWHVFSNRINFLFVRPQVH